MPAMRAPFRWWVLTGVGGTRRFVLLDFTLVLHIPPHFFGLAQRNGVEPQRKALMGWWRPREVSGPTRLSHSRGSCHSAAKVSASRTDWITRPWGEGLGLDVDWRLKVFCPAFLQKSGRGPGAEPMDARRSARNTPCAKEAQEGVKGGTLAGGSPFAGGPAARSPCAAVGLAVNEGKGRRGRRPLRRVGDGPCAAGFTAILSHARAGVGGTRWGWQKP